MKASARAEPSSSAPRMNIGQVLALLREEHPGITIPKIRYLEAEGLIKPERTPTGYRKFSPEDVERLRYVLRLQRDHYLPLKVIREHVDALDAGLEPPAIEGADNALSVPRVALAADGLPGAGSFRERSDLRVSRRELLKLAEVSAETLDELEEYGLVRAQPGTGHFDADALLVASTAAELAAFGLQPRHLRAFKAAADREVGLVRQVVAPLEAGRDASARGRADAAAAEIAALSVRLHATLVKAGLHRS